MSTMRRSREAESTPAPHSTTLRPSRNTPSVQTVSYTHLTENMDIVKVILVKNRLVNLILKPKA